MDYSERLAISYYDTIATINEAHKVYLVQHQETKKIFVKKQLDVYQIRIYEYLKNHPFTGIPQLFHIYEEDGQLTIIEDYVSGSSLQELIDAKALSVDQILSLMCELCDILEKLHTLDPPIIHRDIKPSNILVTPYGHAVLIDFNAAKYLTDKNRSDTMLLGTKGYAAPEQYGFGSSTPQTDIYALGILLKELSEALSEPTKLFDSVIRKCTQMDPKDRIENVQKLKRELEHLMRPNRPKSITRKDLLPPGFRTKTPWKVLTSCAGYLLIFYLSFTLEVKDAAAVRLWIERISFLFLFLSIVFCSFNYCNIWHFMPLCKSEKPLLRCLGVLLLNVIAAFYILLIMSICVSVF